MSNSSNRYMKVIRPLLIFCVMIWMALTPCHAREVALRQSLSLASQLTAAGDTYTLNYKVNLHGDTISLPHNATLKFGGSGRLENGVIIGDESAIIAPRRVILKDMTVSGVWKNHEVRSEWVNFPKGKKSANASMAALTALCNGSTFTHLYLAPGKYYVSAIYWSAPILIPSNVYFHNSAEIVMLPTDMKWYNMVLLDKVDNVTIEGGTFRGDADTHTGTEGEWGHGIRCGGATNVTLKNFTSTMQWGDGIDLIEGFDATGEATINCRNVKISGVKCLHNRRQGLSIEAAEDVEVADSEFAWTGEPLFTAPGAGIDVEPWCGNTMKLKNINIVRCNMHNNKGYDLYVHTTLFQKNPHAVDSRVMIKDCSMGECRMKYAAGVEMEKCEISEKLIIGNSERITFRDVQIFEYEKLENVEGVKFIDCHGGNAKSLSHWTIPIVGVMGGTAIWAFCHYGSRKRPT